jgi:hypothetical protein
LRIYRGEPDFEDILAIGPTSSARRDVRLRDGPNRLTVKPGFVVTVEAPPRQPSTP